MPSYATAPPSVIHAKVVRVGNSLGVRLPASLHLELGAEVEVTIRSVDAWPEGYFDLEPVGEDFVVPPRESAERETEKVRAFLGPVPVLRYGEDEAIHFARLSADLRQQGQLIGVADAMIAATAQTHHCTVVTKNLKHFTKVAGLQVVNWATLLPQP